MSLIDGRPETGNVPPSQPHPLETMFAPKGIAIVGASERSGWSRSTYANLVEGGYAHPIHLVNRTGGQVHGAPSVVSLDEIEGPVELAYVLTGPESLPSVLQGAAEKGIHNLVTIAAGFAEAGPDGIARQRRLADQARELGVQVLGPNNLGFINVAEATAAWSTALRWPLLSGSIAIVSQSGALGASLMNYLQLRDLGFSHLITVGNEASLTVAEVMDYLITREATKVIALYLESVRRPDSFVAAAERAMASGKPVVVYKAGRGAAGARVAAAHTGAFAGDDRVISAVFDRLGIIRVDSLEDLATTAGLLAEHRPVRGRRAGFVMGSGAMCSVIADVAERSGVELPAFDPRTDEAIRAAGLPDFATLQNPLDTTGYIVVQPALLGNIEKAAAQDPNIDVLVVYGSAAQSKQQAAFMADIDAGREDLDRGSPIPIIPMEFLPTDSTPYSRENRRATGKPHVVDSFERGIPALAKAMWWAEQRHRLSADAASAPVPPAAAIDGDFAGAWSEQRVAALLAEHDLPVVPLRLATSADDAVTAARWFGYPVALKVSSPDVAHKTEVGGVRLDLNSDDEVRRAFGEILGNVAAGLPAARLDGVVVTPMREPGLDLLVGFVRDPVWGMTVVIGLGGVWVEVLQDTALRVLPIGPNDVLEMLAELKAYPLLTGFRGDAGVDLGALARTIAQLADLVRGLGDRVVGLEVNPIRVRESTIEILDALVQWANDPEGQSPSST